MATERVVFDRVCAWSGALWPEREETYAGVWWFVAIVPLFGVWAAFFSGISVLQPVGLIAILWPLTVPARAVLATWRSSKFFSKEVWVLLEGGVLYFHGEGRGFKLPVSSVRSKSLRNGYWILRYRLGFVPIAAEAVDEQFAATISAG